MRITFHLCIAEVLRLIASSTIPKAACERKINLHGSYLLFPCEKATIVPELASSCRRAAAIVNSGTRRSNVAARSKLAWFSRSSLSSPAVVKLNDSCASFDFCAQCYRKVSQFRYHCTNLNKTLQYTNRRNKKILKLTIPIKQS